MTGVTLSLASAALVLLCVVVGVGLQRVSGTGAGLVLAPMLTLILGPASGVLLSNVTAFVSCVLLTIAMRRNIQWRKAAVLMVACVPGAFLGALVVRSASTAWLQIIVGGMVLAAVLLIVVVAWLNRLPHHDRPWMVPATGLLGGLTNTIAGVGAPPMVIYAKLTRWSQDHFAATAQPVFMVMNVASVLVKVSTGSVTTDLPPLWLLPAAVTAALVGIGVGALVARRVSGVVAGEIALALAGLGGLTALVMGLLDL